MKAEPKRRTGDLLLPPEIWGEILNRLPAKSILRCRSVCKSWYSLVSCPKFISDYTTRNLNKNPIRLLLQLHDNREHVCSFTSHDESFAESREHDEVAFLGSQVKVVGSCNGLICLSKYKCVDNVKVITFVVWNPTIRRVVELPFRPLCPILGHSLIMGLDSTPRRAITRFCLCTLVRAGLGTKDCVCSYVDSNTNVCDVFDLRKGVWRGIILPVHSRNIWVRTQECYLNGVVHWTLSRYVWSVDRIILSFDMRDEVFREIKMPGYVEVVNGDIDNRAMETRTVTLGGLIHMIMWTWERNYGHTNGDCSVWVMKEYGLTESWTKLFNIDIQIAKIYRYREQCKFRLRENGQVLMVRDLPENIQELV